MRKYIASGLAALLALSAVLTGCGKGEGDAKGGESSSGGEKKIASVCYVTDMLGDKSFSDIANEGLVKAGKDFGLEVKTIEYGTDKSKMEPSMLDAAENFDLVFFYSGELLEVVQRYAEDYPDVKFVGFDIDPTKEAGHPNVFCLTYAQNEGDFLAGALAAKISKTGTIGYVAGRESPVINDFLVGYIEGAQHADPSGKVAFSYIGDFVNTAKAKELALLQIQQNKADVIHQVAAGAGLGVFEAAADNLGTWTIGVDADQRNFFIDSKPEVADVILTSMMKRNDITLYDIIEKTCDGSADFYGTNETWGIPEGVVVLVENDYYKQNTPQDVQDYVKECESKVTSGEIKVSTAYGMDQDTLNEMRNKVKA
ncbi:BMP family ABC transporter substrate-binding protein [Bittarella massiliensis (ex Durand et al. 2017)]|uniref:BMP family ABC transporter substrate-binding protein n=1 Tax=Bittarella massiliensis (ex Durand et al. 2017) TaxID=1720313 RepID=UPI00073E877B|nr:BMP family ABC transporter substrate-binding protein [Bittarella massiliensis (ex Durand et al. 2017)]